MAELLLPGRILAMDARAAERLVAAGSGDGALLYLWLLGHGGKLAPAQARNALRWGQGRLEAAAAALRDMGLSDGRTEAEPAPPPAPDGPPEYAAADITRELEQAGSPFPGLVGEVQRRLGKVLSTADLKSLYTVYDYLALPPEVICLLVNWCVEESRRKYGPGRMPRMGEVQRGAFRWKRLGVDTAQAADAYLKRQELYRTREGEILKLLDLPLRPLVDKERKKVQAWTDMGFDDQALRLAYEKTVYKKQKMDWDYMNGILCGCIRRIYIPWRRSRRGTPPAAGAPAPPCRTIPPGPGTPTAGCGRTWPGCGNSCADRTRRGDSPWDTRPPCSAGPPSAWPSAAASGRRSRSAGAGRSAPSCPGWRRSTGS